MKKYMLTALLLTLGTTLYAMPAGPGDWSKVRLYGHGYNITSGVISGWESSQLNAIQNNCQLFTTEKRHARDYYGNCATEEAVCYASRVYYNRNNDVDVLFYWNAILPYEAHFESVNYAWNAGEDYFELHGRSWPGTHQYKLNNLDCAQWWVDVANYYVSAGASLARFSGVFVDAVPKCETAGYGDYLKDAMDALYGLVIFNGFRVISDTEMQAGPDFLEHADGVYVETYVNHLDTLGERKLLVDTLLDVDAGKYIICNGTSESENGTQAYEDDFEDALAAYLIVANDYTFFRWGGDTGYDQQAVDDIWNRPEYGYAVGAPVSGVIELTNNRYKRVFENCTAVWNLGNPAASVIYWGQNN